jgi:hypothetical protein
MRVVSRVLVAVGLFLYFSVATLAASADSEAWFDGLSAGDRLRLETELVLTGLLSEIPDDRFAPSTFEALTTLQRGSGGEATGVLTATERRDLAMRAAAAEIRFGFATTTDEDALLELQLPSVVLTDHRSTGTGTSYSSADGELSLETIRIALDDRGFPGLFDALSVSDEDRTVIDMDYRGQSFSVGGQVGSYGYRTYMLDAGSTAVGFTVAWGDAYAEDGPMIAAYLTAGFAPLPLPDPGVDEKVAAGVARTEFGAFSLPVDQPELIVLNADITSVTSLDFDRALAARPEARIVALNSPGGAVDSALTMARKIHKLGLSTYVPPQMGCYSACAYMYFAGAGRQAAGELGVHQISSEVADVVFTQSTLGDVLDALEEYGVAQPVISKMLRTPPDDMYIFSGEEIEALGINRGAAIDVAVSIPSPANQPADTGGIAFVELSSLGTREAADRARDYYASRWASVFGDAAPRVDIGEIGSTGAIYRVRVPTASVELANTICAAIRADGGGCFITSGN